MIPAHWLAASHAWAAGSAKYSVGRRVVQPETLLGRRQFVGAEETLEQEVAPLAQFCQTTVRHSHEHRKLARSRSAAAPVSWLG